MARQAINIGSSANDGTGDPLRTAFDKINDNFVELYGGDNDINTLDANLNVNNFAITTGVTNGDITVTPNGTGSILLGSMKFNGTTLSSDDSTIININEGLVVDGTANISGAATLATSLKLATGATVTGILDEDNLGTNSDTQLATQQSIKAYVDAQVTAQDLDFACDDSTTLSIDLDSESLQFSGGTGITTAGTGNTVTVAIDSTVATLTGSQTLTNKVLTNPTINAATMTGAVAINGITLNDNTIIANASDEDLELDGSGSGAVKILANATVVGTLTTADVSTTGNTTVSGSLTTGSFAVGDLNIIADGTITSDTNGDIAIDPAGTGAIVLTGPITHTGTQTTTGQLNVDNLRLDGNTISAPSSGGITLTPAAGQNVTVGGTNTNLTAAEANFTLCEATTLRTNALQNDTSDGDLAISTQGTGAVTVASQLTLTGSFLPAIHTFVATDAVTITEHAGRTLLLGEVGGNAALTLTLPAATGTGAVYKFIVSVTNTSNYKIQVADATDTIDGIMMYLDEDGTAVTAFPTVAASDTITLNGTTQGGVVGDYLELIDIATNQYHVRGVMRVPAGSNPATPFSAAVS